MAHNLSRKRAANVGHHLDGEMITYKDGTQGFRQNVGTEPLPKTAFGELLVVQQTPQVQLKFPYNLNTELAEEKSNNANNTSSVADGLYTMTLSGVASNFTAMKTRDVVRYGAGQGSQFRGTCKFTAGVPDSFQMLGIGDDDEAFHFGFIGENFGIHHKAHGSLEVRELTITAGADATGGTFEIVMDGGTVTIAVDADDTIAEVVAAIVADTTGFARAGRGWTAQTADNVTVQFTSFLAESALGVFSFADVDSGVTAGAFTQGTTLVQGVTSPINTLITQENWNIDIMDGTGPSGHTFDPLTLNVYQIGFQFLGAGMISYSIENSLSGDWQVVHNIRFAGSGSVASMRNPSLRLGMAIGTGAGYSGGDLTMKTGSVAGFIQGTETEENLRETARGTVVTTGSTPVNVLTTHNKVVFHNQVSRVEVFPDFVTVASETGKTVTVEVLLNPTQVHGSVSYTDVNTINSVMEFDTAGTTIVGGKVIDILTVAGGTSTTFDLRGSGLRIRPGDRCVFAATVAGGADAPVTVVVAWRERV